MYNVLIRKFKRESLNETPAFPYWGLCSCVDFNLRNQKTKKETLKKPHEKISLNKKYWYLQNCLNPRNHGVPILGLVQFSVLSFGL